MTGGGAAARPPDPCGGAWLDCVGNLGDPRAGQHGQRACSALFKDRCSCRGARCRSMPVLVSSPSPNGSGTGLPGSSPTNRQRPRWFERGPRSLGASHVDNSRGNTFAPRHSRRPKPRKPATEAGRAESGAGEPTGTVVGRIQGQRDGRSPVPGRCGQAGSWAARGAVAVDDLPQQAGAGMHGAGSGQGALDVVGEQGRGFGHFAVGAPASEIRRRGGTRSPTTWSRARAAPRTCTWGLGFGRWGSRDQMNAEPAPGARPDTPSPDTSPAELATPRYGPTHGPRAREHIQRWMTFGRTANRAASRGVCHARATPP